MTKLFRNTDVVDKVMLHVGVEDTVGRFQVHLLHVTTASTGSVTLNIGGPRFLG